MRTEDETGNKERLTKAEQDRDDLNNERAGREVGRQRRFLPEGADPASMQKRRERERERQSRLMALLRSSTAYTALYNDTMDKLREAEGATDAALTEATGVLDRAKHAYEDGLDRASTLQDGMKVFRDGDGNIRTEDGRLIEGDALDRITWRDGAPSYEDMLARKKAVEQAQRTIESIRRQQVDVGDIRNRMEDHEDPPSVDNMNAWNKHLDEISREMAQVAEPDPAQQPSDASFNHTRLKL